MNCAPADTMSVFVPMEAMRASTWALAPRPMATIVMNAPTPMMMPRAVSSARILCRKSALVATRNRLRGPMEQPPVDQLTRSAAVTQ
jgi:hypothetical protein